MLASIAETHADFAALAQYLIHGKENEQTSPGRVDWIEGHNLATDDPELAAKIMDATAKLSAKVEKPVYHASINWRPDEAPAREEMKDIARRALKLMELEEHQALVVGHGDTSHPHLHMMINRVNPNTGKAWRTSHDYARFDRVMKLLAEDHGFIYAPAKRFKKGDDAVGDPTRSRPTRMSRQQSREIGEGLREQFDEVQSWEDLEAVAALHGLRLEPKGQGLAMVRGQEYARFSDLGSFARMKEFERRFAEPFSSYRRRPMQLIDGIDVVKALVGMGLADRKDIAAAIQDVVQTRETNRPRKTLREELAAAVREHFAFRREIRRDGSHSR